MQGENIDLNKCFMGQLPTEEETIDGKVQIFFENKFSKTVNQILRDKSKREQILQIHFLTTKILKLYLEHKFAIVNIKLYYGSYKHHGFAHLNSIYINIMIILNSKNHTSEQLLSHLIMVFAHEASHICIPNSKNHSPEHGRMVGNLTCLLFSHFIDQKLLLNEYISDNYNAITLDPIPSDSCTIINYSATKNNFTNNNNDTLKRTSHQDTTQSRKKAKKELYLQTFEEQPNKFKNDENRIEKNNEK